jgi:hypothetical protein
MPQCQFLFSAVFVFQRSYTRNILRIGWNEPRSSYFPDTRRSPKQRRRRARRQPHHLVAPSAWSCQCVVWAPWSPSEVALPPIKSLRRENPKGIGIHPRKVPERRRHQTPISGDRSLCSGSLPGWRIAPEPSPSTPPPSPSTSLTPMMRRE